MRLLKFQVGNSYLWLFGVFFVMFFAGYVLAETMGRREWGFISAPLFMAFILRCEVRSEVALDSWFRASRAKGDKYFTPTLVWHAIGLVFLATLSGFAIIG